MSTYDPIVASGTFKKFSLFTSRSELEIEPGQVLVVYRNDGGMLTLLPGQHLTSGNIAWGGYVGYYKVDVGEHNLEFQTSVPCKKKVSNFTAKVKMTCQVENPELIVKNKVRELLGKISPELEQRMKNISKKYEAEDSEDAEDEINDSLESGLHVDGIRIYRIIVDLELDSKTLEHLRSIQGIHYRDKEKETEHEGNVKEIRRQSELEKEEVKERSEFYASIIKKGRWNLYALQLVAKHPEDVARITEMIRQQEQSTQDSHRELLKIFLDKDVIESYQVDDAVKAVLRSLVDELGTGKTKSITDGKAKAKQNRLTEKKQKEKNTDDKVVDLTEFEEDSDE